MAYKANVIILAGGEGRRLRPLTFAIPKPLIPIGEKPILELLLKRLKNFSFKKIFLAVGYRAELIEAYFGDGKCFGLELYYQREKKPLGTAGPVRLIYDKYGLCGSCLVLNADIITDINFAHLIRWHRNKHSQMTVASSRYIYKVPYGTLDIKKDSIQKVREKPSLKFHISTGIYLLEESVIGLIPPAKFYTMPNLMTRIMSKNICPMSYPLTKGWHAIETMDDLEDFYSFKK